MEADVVKRELGGLSCYENIGGSLGILEGFSPKCQRQTLGDTKQSQLSRKKRLKFK